MNKALAAAIKEVKDPDQLFDLCVLVGWLDGQMHNNIPVDDTRTAFNQIKRLLTPSQAVAQERARLREEVVKLMKQLIQNYTGDIHNKSYNAALADVLALLRDENRQS
jgi:hypothetical protein